MKDKKTPQQQIRSLRSKLARSDKHLAMARASLAEMKSQLRAATDATQLLERTHRAELDGIAKREDAVLGKLRAIAAALRGARDLVPLVLGSPPDLLLLAAEKLADDGVARLS